MLVDPPPVTRTGVKTSDAGEAVLDARSDRDFVPKPVHRRELHRSRHMPDVRQNEQVHVEPNEVGRQNNKSNEWSPTRKQGLVRRFPCLRVGLGKCKPPRQQSCRRDGKERQSKKMKL